MQDKRRKVEDERCQSRSVLLPGLKPIRRSRALSQEELARLSGLSKGSIRRLEKMERGAFLRTVRKIAGALDVPPAQLMREHPLE